MRIQTERSQNSGNNVYWDVPFIGEKASFIHGEVWGSPFSASRASGGTGMAAPFRMSVSIKKPPPDLLLEQPSLGNFAEFA